MRSRSPESFSVPPEIRTFDAADGSALRLRHWRSEPCRGQVVLLHGIISHSGWYLRTGSRLADAGFSVHALDRRGSGLNLPHRGDVDRFETWIDDVRGYLARLPSGSPRIVLGISWGGLLATAVARRDGACLAGLGLLCPGFFSRKGTSRAQHNAVRLITALGLGHLRFPVPLRAPTLFTRDAAWQRFIRDDPFTLRRVTLRLATASADLYAETVRQPVHIATPSLLCLGGRDAILDNDNVRRFVQRHFGPDVCVREYADAAHTLEFEANPDAHFRDLIGWCRDRCPTPNAG